MLLAIIVSVALYLEGTLISRAVKKPLRISVAIGCSVLFGLVLLGVAFVIGIEENWPLPLTAAFFFFGLRSEVRKSDLRPSNQPRQAETSSVKPSAAPTTETLVPAIAPNVAQVIDHKIEARITASPTQSEVIEINEDFERAAKVMNETQRCVFVTGRAGTGKSTLLKHFVQNTKKKVALLAPTGIAAINIRGETIHSFFRFPPRPLTREEIRELHESTLYKAIDAIVIDEISMVRADLLDNIDQFLRLNGRDKTKPFGGTQMIFFGDLFQLPPIVSDEEEGKFFASYYKSSYFFDAHVMADIEMEIVELQKVYRQKDKDFIELLNAVRINDVTFSHLQRINHRHRAGFIPDDHNPYITLTTTNKLASEINIARLARLPHTEFTYTSILEGEFPKKSLPTDTRLTLKQQAQVMFVKNDSQRRWVNGTLGKTIKLDEDSIEVEVTSDGHTYTHSVSKERWEILKHKLDHQKQEISTEIVGAFTQYPLKLAWAITIHKSQGLTFDQVIIDLGNGAFAHGQTYVALSRCTTLDGVVLKRQLRQCDIKVDATVKKFAQRKYA